MEQKPRNSTAVHHLFRPFLGGCCDISKGSPHEHVPNPYDDDEDKQREGYYSRAALMELGMCGLDILVTYVLRLTDMHRDKKPFLFVVGVFHKTMSCPQGKRH